MTNPVQITFRNMASSKALENNIRGKAAKLQSFTERIISCRVIVEAPHRHHYKGKAYVVRIVVKVPGEELTINRAPKRLAAAKLDGESEPDTSIVEHHQPSKHAAHQDAYVAIRDAFNAAARKLRDYARRLSGSTKQYKAARSLARTITAVKAAEA